MLNILNAKKKHMQTGGIIMNNKANAQVLLSIDDLEKQYAIKRGAFYGMMKNGLKTIKMPGQRGKRLVRKSTLEAFLKKFEK